MQGNYESLTGMRGGVMQRQCVLCGEWKPLTSDYHKNGQDSHGRQEYRQECKVCYNIKRKENKGRNKKCHSDFIGGQKRRGEEAPELSHQDWKEVLIFFSGECAYCGATPRPNKRLTRDHIHPVSKGGKTESGNIIPACASCNSAKGDEDVKDWYMKQPFFSQERLNKIFKWRTIMRQAGNE